LGYDVSHHDHGEGLRKHEAKVQKPENTPRRPSSKWFSRKTLETYGHLCTEERDKNTAELINTLQDEFNQVYMKTYNENTILALHKMQNDIFASGHLFSDNMVQRKR
jgi:protein-arginine kinase